MARDYCSDERVIGAFLSNYRMCDIIRESGLSKRTAYKVRNNPEFQMVLRERKNAIIQAAVNKMQGYMTKDAEILQEIIEDASVTPQTRVYAIQVLMNQLRDWTTTADIIRRLEALQSPSVNAFNTV